VESIQQGGFTHQTQFDCPVAFMQRRHKKLVWFDDLDHLMFEEESGKALVHLAKVSFR